MPYDVNNPPERIKDLPKHAQEIFIGAFNSAIKQYEGDEGKANATAWSAVETKYKKDESGKWVAKESVSDLQRMYSELISTASVRNTRSIASKLQKLTESVTWALDKPTDGMIAPVMNMIGSLAVELKALEAVKTEDGSEFLSLAYAYVPDSEKPTTWKLRLWEDPQKKVTRAQLGKAAAAFSPGGFRGNKAELPSEDLAAVKRKIRAEYRKLDVADEDMPKWIQESEKGDKDMLRTLIADYVPLKEAKIGDKGTAQIVVIKSGFNANKERYYPPEMLARDFSVFEGVKMYADHPTPTDEKERPERSVKDWVATLKNVHIGSDGFILGEAIVVEPWMQAKLATLRDKNMLGEIGVSINAIGSGSRGEIQGTKTNIIEKIIRARSVDFVTEPGAGGGVNLYESDKDLDIDLVGLDVLREHRPDLIKEVENNLKPEIIKEVKHVGELEDKIKTLEASVTALTTERDGLKAKIEEANKAKAIAETKAKLNEALTKCDLPQPAKDRILLQFKDATSDTGIADAIKAEAGYIALLKEAGKVTNLGPGQYQDGPTRDQQKASWKGLHPEWTDKQVDMAIDGR